MTLEELGWNDSFAAAYAPYQAKGWVAARLIRETSINFGAIIPDDIPGEIEEIEAIVCGKVWHEAQTDADLPAVGDWVAIELGKVNEDNVIRALLPRQSCFSRKAPGKTTEEQVIGANVDVVIVVTDPGPDHNPRRMERYFTLISRSKAQPVVLVNKGDIFPKKQCQQAVDELQELCPEAKIHIVSALKRHGLKVLKSYLKTGITMCIVGSSGVGKSTLVNQLFGDEWQWTSEVNEVTGKGRHTTTSRELVPLKGGGMLIDNPGMREIQMWTDEQTLRDSFADVEELSNQCQFRDCKHGNDQGCAIRAAVKAGGISTERVESFLRLDDEIGQLRKRAKKRQMTVERWAKRNSRVKARNLNDRIQLEKDERGDWS